MDTQACPSDQRDPPSRNFRQQGGKGQPLDQRHVPDHLLLVGSVYAWIEIDTSSLLYLRLIAEYKAGESYLRFSVHYHSSVLSAHDNYKYTLIRQLAYGIAMLLLFYNK